MTRPDEPEVNPGGPTAMGEWRGESTRPAHIDT